MSSNCVNYEAAGPSGIVMKMKTEKAGIKIICLPFFLLVALLCILQYRSHKTKPGKR